MKPRRMTALGIDIGSRRISAALVERAPHGFRLLAAANADLPADSSSRPRAGARAVSRMLRSLGRRDTIRSVRSAMAVSSGSTILRLLDLPRPMPANVAEFVDAELNQYVVLSGRPRSVDYCGIGTGSALQKRLLAVAADTEEVRQALKMCGPARIAVDCVEPAVLAYARAILASQKDAGCGSTLIAVLDACNLVICLFCKGTLDFVRIREVPTDMDSCQRLCAWLTQEVNVVAQYQRAAGSDAGSELQIRLAIHGASYDKAAVAALFAPDARSSFVVDSFEPLRLFSEGTEDVSCAPSAIAVGAALRLLGVEGDELRVDLTPHEVILAKSSSRRLWIAANVLAGGFLAASLISHALARTTDAMHRRIGEARVSEQLCTMPAVVAQNQYLDEEIAQVQRQLAGLAVVRTKRQVNWPTLLNGISQSAPPGTRLIRLASGDGRSISLKGVAMSYRQLETLMRRLDDRGLFQSVRLARMERRLDGVPVVEYEIECTLKPAKTEESARADRSQS
jgi:Tfp pilus assembly protein PilN